MSKNNQFATISADEYTEDYYHTSCGGYKEFNESKGIILPRRFQIPLQVSKIDVGDVILDIGCGRGEILYHAAKAGAYAYGMDYSAAAVKISSQNINDIGQDYAEKIIINAADAKKLPFKSGSFDFVFMLDIIEHLYPDELDIAYNEVWRVLKDDGKLVIHTTPNLWYYHIGYPFFRFAQQLRNVFLPKNPRDRWLYSHVHVNEQTPYSMYKLLTAKGFKTKVWLESTQSYDDYDVNSILRIGMKLLTSIYPFRFLFCDDIFAVCIKK